ncbi:phosphoribosyl-AMP cyclohydrolase [Alicyclobacillus sp. ALC3]|nr:phosphoribosyl-AMP cyclohydrolase [Alicyclobacillus sp. ALC3]WDL99350.1 phosphoribosyl-AMP cyclohydrolase [Alicyclobacillus sp. ALC3]
MDTVALEGVRYDAVTGLVPVVVQDRSDSTVLMVAYANREALKRTLATGQGWFWSRSRSAYWRKGETSGNVLVVREVRVDCDGDTVLYLVDAAGPACHTGERSCFYRRVQHAPESNAGGQSAGTAPQQVPAREVCEESNGALRSEESGAPLPAEEAPGRAVDAVAELTPLNLEALTRLWAVVCERDALRPAGAYTTYLFEQGVDKVAKKVGEEAVEVAIAAKNAVSPSALDSAAGRQELASESADLLYHLLVLWKAVGLSPDAVSDILQNRAHG